MSSNNAVIGYFSKEAWRQKKLAIPVLFLIPSTIILQQYIAPLLIAYILGSIQAGNITLENSVWVIVGFIFIQLYSQLVGFRVSMWLSWTIQVRGEARLYDEVFRKLSKHSLSFFSSTFTGSLVSKVNRFTAAYMRFVNIITWDILFLVTTVLATIIGLAIFVWQYALILLALVIIFIVCSYFGTQFMRKRFKERSESYNDISGNLADAIGNMLAVKTDAREKTERRLLDTSVQKMVTKEYAARNGMVLVTSVYAVVTSLMKAAALIASIWSVQAGIGNAALIYIVLTYTFNLVEQMWDIGGLFRSYYELTGDSSDTLEMIQQPVSVKDKTKIRLKVNSPEIRFDEVSFTHEETKTKSEDAVLFNNFSIHIPANQKLGLVGASGSGKSTLFKLLMRFYDVDKGTISIDGHNISRVTQQSLHDNIAYVPQEPLLFHRSILENIAYSRPDATIEQVREAAAQANALEFIEELPEGFETLVGERGVKLSGGQRQRIAIARAILKDAPILILDEATSALDSESEQLIQQALKKLMKGRTSIVIAHRLSTISSLDRIIVLDKGTIVEDGAHSDLIKKEGTYAKLWAHQSGGFLED